MQLTPYYLDQIGAADNVQILKQLRVVSLTGHPDVGAAAHFCRMCDGLNTHVIAAISSTLCKELLSKLLRSAFAQHLSSSTCLCTCTVAYMRETHNTKETSSWRVSFDQRMSICHISTNGQLWRKVCPQCCVHSTHRQNWQSLLCPSVSAFDILVSSRKALLLYPRQQQQDDS